MKNYLIIFCFFTMILLCFHEYELFRSNIPTTFKNRSVELYNPSMYNGYFIRKFNVPNAYTRTTVTYPSHTPLYITKSYLTKGNKYDMMTKNIITPLWNIAEIYPLQNRREMLV